MKRIVWFLKPELINAFRRNTDRSRPVLSSNHDSIALSVTSRKHSRHNQSNRSWTRSELCQSGQLGRA